MNLPSKSDLDHQRLWTDHDFSVSVAICIWANYFTTPTMTRAESELGLNRDDCNVLIALWLFGELTAGDISFLQGRPRNSISRAVNRLLDRDLIEGRADEGDARRTRLQTTALGKEIMEDLIPIFEERQNLMLRRLSKRQKAALHNLLSMTLTETNRWAEDM